MDEHNVVELLSSGFGEYGAAAVGSAHEMAVKQHEGQTYGDSPYLDHVCEVAMSVKQLGYKFVVVALLHDVVEDTDVGLDEIDQMFGPIIAQSVDAITRRQGEVYFEEYIPRVMLNYIAMHVKLADATYNLAQDGKPELNVRYEHVIDLIGPQIILANEG